MRTRLVRSVVLAVFVVSVVVLATSGPASACSEPGPFDEDLILEDIDESTVIAVGQAEVVARTGPTWRWHRAGVVAFTQAWFLSEKVTVAAETVWTINDGRDRGGDCYFGRDAPLVGSQQGLYVLFDDGGVSRLTGLGGDSFDSVAPADLTARYGEPASVTPDPARVDAAFAPLVAERRTMTWLVRIAAAVGVGVGAIVVVRRRARPSMARSS